MLGGNFGDERLCLGFAANVRGITNEAGFLFDEFVICHAYILACFAGNCKHSISARHF
jgi:hypothetical protein